MSEKNMKIFKVTKWRVKTKSESLLVIAVYHPPYSTTNHITNTAFLDEFTNWITMDLTQEKNIFIADDFNIHINNTDTDDNVSTFLEIIETMDLQQHVTFNTHWKGTSLDLVLTESYSRIIIKNCTKCHLYLVTV